MEYIQKRKTNMINRTQSRQFLYRGKLNVQIPLQQNVRISDPNVQMSMRSYSGSQNNNSNHNCSIRNTVGVSQALKIRQRLESNPNKHHNKIQYSYERLNNTFHLVEKKSQKEFSIDRSCENDCRKQHRYEHQVKAIQKLMTIVTNLGQKIQNIEKLQKFQQQRNQFNIKNTIQSTLEEYEVLSEKKLCHNENKLKNKLNEEFTYKLEKMEEKLQNKIQAKISSKLFSRLDNKLQYRLQQKLKKLKQISQKNVIKKMIQYQNKLVGIQEIFYKQIQNMNTTVGSMKQQMNVDSIIQQLKLSINKQQSQLKKHVKKIQDKIEQTVKNNIKISNKEIKAIKKGVQPLAMIQLCMKLIKKNKNIQDENQLKQNNQNIIIQKSTSNLKKCIQNKGNMQVSNIYGVDYQGYLMDSQNKYLLTHTNSMIRIDGNMIEKLKEIGINIDQQSQSQYINQNCIDNIDRIIEQ